MAGTPFFEPQIVRVRATSTHLTVTLNDDRQVTVPIEWFPRLHRAAPAQREDCRIIGGGSGVHWPQVDEDVSLESLIHPERMIFEGGRRIEPRASTS